MKHERATEEIRELAALYALGSLTQHEARSFETHMQEGCSVCEEELRKFEHVVAGLGLAVEEVETPDYVRDLLLARIEREPQRAAPAAAPERKSEPEPPKQNPPPYPAQSILFQSSREKPGIFPWILAAAFAALAVLALYSWKSAQATNAQLEARVSAVQTDSDNLQILLDVQKAKASDLEQILATVSKPGARIARLAGQAVSPSASGAILWDTEQNRCLLFGVFPPAPQGKAYQLWFVTPAAKVSAGLVQEDATGRTFTAMPVPSAATDAPAVVVTLEPDSGSQIPSMPFYAVGRFE